MSKKAKVAGGLAALTALLGVVAFALPGRGAGRDGSRNPSPPDSPRRVRERQADALADEAYDALEAGNLVIADARIQEAITLFPYRPDYWQTYGDVLLRQGHKGEALEYYRRAIIDGANPYGQPPVTGTNPEAEIQFAELCEETPGCTDAQKAHAQAARNSQYIAYADVPPGERGTPRADRALAYYSHYRNLLEQEKPEEAKAALSEALRTAPPGVKRLIGAAQQENDLPLPAGAREDSPHPGGGGERRPR